MNAPLNPQAAQPTAEVRRFDPRQLIVPLFKHKWLVLGVAVAVAVLVVFWTLRMPRMYEAVVTLKYDPNPIRPLGNSIEDVADQDSNYWATHEFIQSENYVLQSRSLSERVVRKVGLNHDASFFGVPVDERRNWRGVSVEYAAQMLQMQISVEGVRDTRIVEIRVLDQDPERAAVLANAIADEYREKTMEDRTESTESTLNYLNPRLDDLKRRLEASEIALHEFKRDHDVLSVSMEDRQNLVANAIEQLSQQVTTVRAKRIELGARLGQLRSANREDPFDVHASELAASQEATHLREGYRAKIAERQSLATRYGLNHPRMQALNLEIDTLRAQMHAVVQSVIDEVAGDLREAQATERGLMGALAEANAQGLELNLREIEYSRLNRERENNSKLYGVLLERTTETELGKTRRVSRAQIIDRAIKPTEPVSPRIRVNIAGGILAGLMLGIAAAFLAARLDRTVKTVEDAEGLGLTVIGMLPSIEEGESEPEKRRRRRRRGVTDISGLPGGRDLIVHTRPMSSVAEFCRTIRTNLMFMSADNPLRTLLVTSPGPREGKTTVATSIAITLAQSSKRVLLIDTDLRRPRIHRTFDCPSTVGTTSVLVGDASLEEAVQETVVPGLFILPCGPIPPNPAELLHTAKFRELVEEASRTFDRVVLDSPPLGAVTDAAIISPQVQGTILVVKAQATARDAVRTSLRQLNDVGSNILGGILNDVDLSEQNYGYGSYYGGYYYARGNYYTSTPDNPSGPSVDATAAE